MPGGAKAAGNPQKSANAFFSRKKFFLGFYELSIGRVTDTPIQSLTTLPTKLGLDINFSLAGI